MVFYSMHSFRGERLRTDPGYFGVLTPEPALVGVDAALARLVAARVHGKAAIVTNSVGLNFGCRLLVDAATWPIDKSIPEGMRQAAFEVFAFDALVQNSDRRFANANLLVRGNDIFVFDHEFAFSFLLAIRQDHEPWRVARFPFLFDHVFFRQLKGAKVEVEPFLSRLRLLPEAVLGEVLAEVPPEWNNGCVGRIERHLRDAAEHAGEFAAEIQMVLA